MGFRLLRDQIDTGLPMMAGMRVGFNPQCHVLLPQQKEIKDVGDVGKVIQLSPPVWGSSNQLLVAAYVVHSNTDLADLVSSRDFDVPREIGALGSHINHYLGSFVIS
jgi:hypothetical protein